jgi:hypothetical protein
VFSVAVGKKQSKGISVVRLGDQSPMWAADDDALYVRRPFVRH